MGSRQTLPLWAFVATPRLNLTLQLFISVAAVVKAMFKVIHPGIDSFP